jgi:hypothetical protein
MKYLVVFASLTVFANVALASDPCEQAAHKAALRQQHEDYPGKKWDESNPSDPEAVQSEEKSNGFETWDISYSVDEECLEGWTYLMRRSGDGQTCAVIKIAVETSRDCG